MTSLRIDKLEDLFPGIIKCQIIRLTAPGENYGSLMLGVNVTVQRSDSLKNIYAVAKTVPPDERMQEAFNTEKTFRNEIAFYKDIVPLLQNFQKEHGVPDVIDFPPQYYGSRLNLNRDESKVDSDGVLLLENLKVAGFKNMERTEGFDLEITKLVLSDLAHLHMVNLALRRQKKAIFEEKVVPHLSTWGVSVDFHNLTKQKLEKTVANIPQLSQFEDRILSGFDKKLQPPQCREPFATVIHNDCWVNNTMVKFEGTTPVKTKMVDFQECTLASLAKDVIFFLFSSVKTSILEKYYEQLVQYYFDTAVSVLSELKCDIPEFSFAKFEKELAFEAEHSQFGHLMFMLYPIFATRRPELVEITLEELLEMEPTDLHKEKLVFIVKEFAKRHWI